MPKGKMIAQGRTAEIFEWGDGRVLNLYRQWCPPTWAQYEARVTRAVHAAGVPVPEIDDTVQLENRHGIIMERIDGPTLTRQVAAQPWRLNYFAHQLADLQIRINAYRAPELQDQRSRLERMIRSAASLPPDLKELALRQLVQLPDADMVCHYDLHPMNILVSKRGPVVIDWTGAAKGHPLSDLARTWLLMLHARNPNPTRFEFIIMLFRHLYYAAYLGYYSRSSPFSPRALSQWKIPILAARFGEDISVEQPLLRQLLQSALNHPL